VARDYLAEAPGADLPERRAQVAAVASWLTGRWADPTAALTDTLTGLHVDGYTVGAVSALAALGGQPPRFGGWTPGDTGAARTRLGEIGAAAGLAALPTTVPDRAAGIASTRREAAARTLIERTGAGDDPADVGAALLAGLADPGPASVVAVTEAATAAAVAAMGVYEQHGVPEVRWAADPSGRPCPVCTDNAAAGAVPVGSVFPSGHRSTPAHPGCRCAVLPA
jgi:hypothetical protein